MIAFIVHLLFINSFFQLLFTIFSMIITLIIKFTFNAY